MYELKKKIGKVLTSKSVGTRPSSREKSIYQAAVTQRLRNTRLSNPASMCVRQASSMLRATPPNNTDPKTLNYHIQTARASEDGILFHRKFASPFATSITDIGRPTCARTGWDALVLPSQRQTKRQARSVAGHFTISW